MRPLETHQSAPILLHLHIPKTAGSTLKHCIYEQYANGPKGEPEERGWLREGVFYYPTGFLKPKRPVIPQWIRRALARNDINAVVGHFQFGIHQFVPKPTTYVTLVREPVDRVVSFYYHLHGAADERVGGITDVTLDDFVSSLALRETDNDQTRRIAGLEPPFGRCTEKTLASAKDNLIRNFSVVGVTHRFDETLVLLKRLLNWGDLYYLPGLINKARPPRSGISPATIDRIAGHNRLDEELFRFAETLLDEAIAAQGPDFADELKAFKVWNAQHIARWTAQE
jgi:Galactose-3-O-sulfotransferase